MAVSKYKTWVPNEILTAADLNASFDQVFNNQGSFGYPRDGVSDFNGFELILDADADTSITADTDDRIDLKLGGQDLFIFDGTVISPVNGFTFKATATGSPPEIQAQGLDANIGITLTPKGTGAVTIAGPVVVTGPSGGFDLDGNPLTIDADGDSSLRATSDDVVALRLQGVDAFIFDGDVGSSANGATFTTAASGGDVSIVASGADAAINLAIAAKGAGQLKLAGGPVTATPTNDGVVKANASGKLADGWLAPSNVDQHADVVLLSVSNFTAASAVDFNSSVINGTTYREFHFSVRATFSVDDTKLGLRTDTADGASVDQAATDYFYAMTYVNSGNATADAGTSASSVVMNFTGASGGVGSTPPESLEGDVWVIPGNASTWPKVRFHMVYIDELGRLGSSAGGGHRRAVGPINFVRLLPLTGTMTGTVWCYGRKAA